VFTSETCADLAGLTADIRRADRSPAAFLDAVDG
jgi:hypothetical protein